MDKRWFKVFAGILVALAMGSCVYDFTPDADDLQGLDKPLVVIEGDIIVGGMTNVKLGYSRSVLNGIENEEIDYTGTSVWVESEKGEVWNGRLAGGVTSSYRTSNEMEVDTRDLPMDGRYRLCVSVPGRGEYRSAFKQPCVSPQIDTISFSFTKDGKGIQFEVSTHNDSQEPLYCKWSFVEDWESNAALTPSLRSLNKEGSIVFQELTPEEKHSMTRCFSKGSSKDIYIAGTEKLSQNIIHNERLNTVAGTDRRISSLYAITITQTALDKEAFKYWEGVKASISGTGGLFAPMPNEVRGNIVCDTYPDENVLGYINVSTATTKRRMVEANEVQLYRRSCTETAYPDSVWLELHNAGNIPVRYGEDEKGNINKNEVYWTSAECADCRTFSNSTRPDFWPQGR